MLSISRKSSRLFDLEVKGSVEKKPVPYLFSSWLPLWAIRELVCWTKPEVAMLTDYPEMVMEGDWSGVRDSDNDKIWTLFHRFALSAA